MSIDLSLQDRLRKQKDTRDAERTRLGGSRHGGGSGGPPDDSIFEQRFRAIENSITAIDKSLAVITEQLKHVALQKDVVEIAGKLDLKANAIDVAELRGRVARIPTVPTLVSIGLLISLLFAAASWAVRHLPPSWLS